MSQATDAHPPYRDHDASKTAALRPFGVQNLSEETQYYEGEHNSRPSTPSMTIGSSRSNSSSIITCDTCGNAGSHCACTGCSDSESIRVFNRDEWTGSPQNSPALLARQGNKKSYLVPPLPPLNRPSSPQPTIEDTKCSFPQIVRRHEVESQSSASLTIDGITGKQNSPFHLMNSNILSPSAPQSEVPVARNPMECLTSDSEEDDDDSDESDSAAEDNDWSGQDTSLEAIILNAVGEDLPLAAHLIPILHRSLRSEFAINATQKLGSWRHGVIKSTQGTGAGDEQTSNTCTPDSTNNPRKRQRRQDDSKKQNQCRKIDDLGEGDDEDDDDPQDSRGLEDDIGTEGQQALPFLACPFHKRDPAKYSSQSTDAQYRSCGGPGWKSQQRVKEHLKRKHYPVQCDRCYRIFPGSDRAACVLDLQRHRQLPVMCMRGPDSEKEGISEAQWAKLDKRKSSKKSQIMSRIDLWMEYWDTIFPETPRPETPWYENQLPSRLPQPTSEDVRRFADFFRPMLNLKVNQQYICFLEGQEDVMKTRVEDLVYLAFKLHLGLTGSPSVTNSSSSRTRSGPQSSLLDGSFQNLSTPTNRGQHSSLTSRSTAAQSQAYSMDVASSPVALQMASRSLSQGHPTRMAPQFIPAPRIPNQAFASNTISPSMSNDHQTHGTFHSNMAGTIGNFGGDPFADSSLGAGDSQWQMDFATGNPGFYSSHPAPALNSAGYVDISPSPLDHILDPSDDNGGGLSFDQYQNPGNLRYDGTPQ